MDFVGSPLVTIVLNVIASGLVSHGILDLHSKDVFVQLVNNAIAAGVTFGVAVYSIYKVVDLHKHKITTTGTQKIMTLSQPAEQSKPEISQQISQPTAPTQTGLPIGQ